MPGWTALHVAASLGKIDLLRMLLEHGADARIQSRDGNTAADIAEQDDHQEIADSLREAAAQQAGANILPVA
jgi:ankyrin repeat protein